MSGQLSIVHMESSLLVSFPLSELDSLLFSVWKKANSKIISEHGIIKGKISVSKAKVTIRLAHN